MTTCTHAGSWSTGPDGGPAVCGGCGEVNWAGPPPWDYPCDAFEDADYEDGRYVASRCGSVSTLVNLETDEGTCQRHVPIRSVRPLAALAVELPLAWTRVMVEGEYGARP